MPIDPQDVLGIPPEILGPAAGVATSSFWTATSICFTAAGKRIGPMLVNAIRLVAAVILLALTFRFMTSTDGSWIPEMTSAQLWYLALSGVIGLTIGDQALFTAFVDVGPRIALLVMTTSPLFAAIFGWIWLHESLSLLAWTGILLTMAGVGVVILDRPATPTGEHPPHRVRGIVLALIGAICQAGGLMLSKVGMGHGLFEDESAHMDPQAATYVRMVAALIAMVPLFMLGRLTRKTTRPTVRTGSRNAGYTFAIIGAFVGPYLGVWFSLVAADLAPVGVAQTLISLSPILILPFAAKLYGEKIGVRAVVGAMIAVLGAVLLFV